MTADKPKIMVVDDDQAMLLSVVDILEFDDFDVCGVSDGHQAIEKASSEHFNLILMDVNMPGIDGVEAFRQIRQKSPGTMVVMMTGFSVEDLVQQALDEGAYTVLYKPLEPSEILSIVRSVVESACVLVVDDDQDSRDSLRMLLEDSGMVVGVAHSGIEAVLQVKEKHFGVVLMDIGMPGINGYEACERVLDVDPRAKVVFVTGHQVDDCAKQALSAGAFSLISKPVEPEDMLEMVSSLLGNA